MRTATRLAAFAAVLALVGGLAAVAGGAIEPGRIGGEESTGEEHASGEMTEGAEAEAAHGSTETEAHEGAEEAPGGLAVAEAGFRLELDRSELSAGRPQELSFRIVDDAGAPVTDFEIEHGKRLHLIVVRRDLSGFQHLHPEMAADGTWSTPLSLGAPGPYRVFADFASEGEDLTLGADLTAPGGYAPRPLPAAADSARVDGYEVDKTSDGHGGFEFRVSRDGEPVEDLQPYLGARGHLVVIREGDLGYLHVHPEDESAEPSEIGFHAALPTAGRYRMFLQFRHEDEVRTVEFTEESHR